MLPHIDGPVLVTLPLELQQVAQPQQGEQGRVVGPAVLSSYYVISPLS